MIDFAAITSSIMPGFRAILSQWLPGGQYQGEEYTVRNPNRSDKTPGSFKINARTGSWSDFAVGKSGGDPISLYAYIKNINNGQAASELARSLGISTTGSAAGQSSGQSSGQAKKGRIIYTDLIYPAPADAPPPPTEKNIFDEQAKEWHKYPIKFHWAYKNQLGQLLGYVVRYETETGKETPPITLWRTAEHGLRWRYKTFPDPRPLYHLDKLAHSPEAGVIIVEGEKCAETLQGMIESAGLDSRFVTVSWPGGAKSIQKIDWSPLRGRRCILWPDFDLQEYPENHAKAGEVMPYSMQPGMRAMLDIAAILRGLDGDAQIKIIQQQPDFPAGWDVADAILVDGWDLPRIMSFIKLHSVVADVKPVALKSKSTAAPAPAGLGNDTAPTRAAGKLDDAYKAPFRPLGYRGDYCFYLPSATREVKAIKGDSHGKGSLLTLADITYWERAFCGDYSLAANTLLRLSEKAGVYDPMKQRGRGGWYDEGRAVLHLGDRLIVNDERVALDDIKSGYIYEAGPTIEYTGADPLSVEDAHRLRAITDSLFWSKSVYSIYLSGWCFIASICGCLRNRPHIWVTGGAGTGKSYVVDSIVRPTLGDFALHIQHESTAAGVRQRLGCDALPVLVDEFEGEDFNSQLRQQSMLELARQAFSDTGAQIVKGSQGGKAVSYQIRSTFCFSSIGVNISQHADETRIMVLSLEKPHDREDLTAGEHFTLLRSLVSSTLTPAYCAGLRARALKMIPVVRANAETFAQVIGEKLKSRRIGDQVGALLAGAWALSSDNIISEAEAREWVDQHDWSEQKNVISDTDESNLLNTIMSEIVFIGSERKSVGEIAQGLYNMSIGRIEMETPDIANATTAKAGITRCGIKYDQENRLIWFGNSHPGLKRMLDKTPWAKTYSRILKRIPGAVQKRHRFHGTILDAVGLPLERVIDV